MTPEARKNFAKLNAAWLKGEKVDDLKFLHNSIVEVTLEDGAFVTGGIVGASTDGPEPIYTVELHDDSGDFECPAAAIRTVNK